MKGSVSALLLGLLVVAAPVASQAAAKPQGGMPGGAHTAPAAKMKYDAAKLKVLEDKLAKNPKDAKLKTETAEANYQVGFQMEYNSNLPPREKYRGSLTKYRRALELNPKHANAAKEKKQIEDVYKSMGMPVPK